MNNATKSALLLMASFGSLLLCNSCSQNGSGSGTQNKTHVYVKADLSLKPTLQEVMQYYQQETSVITHLEYVSSTNLVLDASADSIDVYLVLSGNLPDSSADTSSTAPQRVRTIAYAIPCMSVPQLNPAMIANLADLRNSNVRLGIADPELDILGAFALEILQKNDLYENLRDRLVIVGPSAVELADQVARKELEVVIGWTVFPNWTQGAADIVLLGANEIPRVADISAVRAAVPVDSASAQHLMTFLYSDRCRELFRKWGYAVSQTDLEMYAPVAEIGGAPNLGLSAE